MKIVSYYRVSTKRQGESGLGLEAQATAVEHYRKSVAGSEIASYQEIESGKNSDRPQLAKAINHARMARAVLVVAKLDRLARDVSFLSALMKSGVDFVCCDNPTATKLTLHILASVAEAEAEAISLRTKAALAAAKKRGTQLGSSRVGHWEGREPTRLKGLSKARMVSAKVRSAASQKAREDLLPVALLLKSQGLPLPQVADELNKQGFLTRQGKPWNQFSVCRLLKGAT